MRYLSGSEKAKLKCIVIKVPFQRERKENIHHIVNRCAGYGSEGSIVLVLLIKKLKKYDSMSFSILDGYYIMGITSKAFKVECVI